MGKTSSKRPRGAKRRSSAPKNSRDVDLKAVQRKLVNHLGNEACKMMETTTEAFEKNPSIGTLKYLFESIGLFPCTPGEQASGDDGSLAVTLLRRLGAPEEKAGEAEASNDSGVEFVRVAEDAVE